MPTEPVSGILATMFADNVTDEATISELVGELLSKIYVASTVKGVLYDLSGRDLIAMLKLAFGIPAPFVSGGAADNAERTITTYIPFGLKPLDKVRCLPAHPAGSLTTQITLGTSSNVDGADYSVSCDVLPGVTPTHVLSARTINYTPVQTGAEVKIRLLEDGVLFGILLFGTTVRTTIDSWNLYINDATQFIEELDLVNKARVHMSKKLGSYLGKFAVYEKVPAAAADGGPVTLPAALEDGYDLMTYSFVQFGEDPADWLNLVGVKAELGITAGDTNPIRVIPLVLKPI